MKLITEHNDQQLEYITEQDKNGKKKKSILTGFTDNNTDKKVHFTIDFAPGELDKLDVVKKLKLEKKFSNTNMHLYSVEGSIKKYKKIILRP